LYLTKYSSSSAMRMRLFMQRLLPYYILNTMSRSRHVLLFPGSKHLTRVSIFDVAHLDRTTARPLVLYRATHETLENRPEDRTHVRDVRTLGGQHASALGAAYDLSGRNRLVNRRLLLLFLGVALTHSSIEICDASQRRMHFLDRVVSRAISSVYGCGAGILRAVGQNAYAKYILSVRTVSIMEHRVALLQAAIRETQDGLKCMIDDMNREEALLASAVMDAREMATKRIEQRREHAERMGSTFVYRKEDLFIWMNDYEEIQRIEDVRIHKMMYDRMRTSIGKMQATKHELQTKQAFYERLIGEAQMLGYYDRIAETLEDANSVIMDNLFDDMLNKVMRYTDALQETEMHTKEAEEEVKMMLSALPGKKDLTPNERNDIIDMVFETTTFPSPKEFVARNTLVAA